MTVELVLEGSVSTFDATVILRSFRGQDDEGNGQFLTRQFEFGHEFRTTIDLNGADGKRRGGHKFVEESLGGGTLGVCVDLGMDELGVPLPCLEVDTSGNRLFVL